MHILVISDIHANLTALETVLEAAGPMDATWCLGDVVGYGSDPNECISRLLAIPNMVCLIGNHDAAALGRIELRTFNRDARLSIEWTRQHLAPTSVEFLKSLPDRLEINGVTLVHGSPRNPVWEYVLDSSTAEQNFKATTSRFCFIGHTHLPVIFYYGNGNGHVSWQLLRDGESPQLPGRALLNPGSVGQPRDHDPRASYAIFDTEAQTWKIFRVEYDISAIQKRIRQAGLPFPHANRLLEGW